MKSKRFPYALIAVGLLGMLLYPRLLLLNVPAFMRTDIFRGFFYGICLGIEIWGVILSKNLGQSKA